MTRPNSIRLNCESLEAREVPAVVVEGTAATPTLVAGMPPTPNGGTVTIGEVAFAATDLNVINQAFSAFETTTRSAAANDNITLTQSGSTLTINSSDGIFIRFTANAGQTYFHNRGNTLTIPNVTGLTVNLQLGGNDSVVDNTALASTINGGTGNDTLTATGGAAKVLNGGDGNDIITDNATGATAIDGGPGNDILTVAGIELNPALLPFLFGPTGLNIALLPLLGATAAKTVNGGDGNDTLTATGFATNFTFDGGAGDDMINGPQIGFINSLKGGDGNDTIVGGFGLDILEGGAGFDVLFGLGGGDFYIALDGGPDFVLNQRGEFVFADPFDIKSAP
jgi:Ca2+-binding RTX toxin-like protein